MMETLIIGVFNTNIRKLVFHKRMSCNLTPYRPNLEQKEKINLNFYFHTS